MAAFRTCKPRIHGTLPWATWQPGQSPSREKKTSNQSPTTWRNHLFVWIKLYGTKIRKMISSSPMPENGVPKLQLHFFSEVKCAFQYVPGRSRALPSLGSQSCCILWISNDFSRQARCHGHSDPTWFFSCDIYFAKHQTPEGNNFHPRQPNNYQGQWHSSHGQVEINHQSCW